MRCENCGAVGPCPWQLRNASGVPWKPTHRFFPDAPERLWLRVCDKCAEECRHRVLFVVEPAQVSNVNFYDLIFGKEG